MARRDLPSGNSQKLTLYGVYDTVIAVDRTNFGLLVVARFFGGTGDHEITFRLHNAAGKRVGWGEESPKAKLKCKKQGFVDIVANISKISLNDGELAIICPAVAVTPGVCGGAARISGTRIPVWQLWQNHNSGVSDDQLSKAFGIDLATLKSVWQYCELNAESLNRLVEANRAA